MKNVLATGVKTEIHRKLYETPTKGFTNRRVLRFRIMLFDKMKTRKYKQRNFYVSNVFFRIRRFLLKRQSFAAEFTFCLLQRVAIYFSVYKSKR